MKAILYIGHGTRSRKGADEARKFIQRIMARIDVPIQEMSFLELAEPLIEAGFKRCIERGATEITVVPLFLLAAGHIKEDIPNALAGLREKYHHVKVNVKDPFGVQENILDGLAELVKEEAGRLTAKESILLVGRGSSDPDIQADFADIVDGMRNRLGINRVSVCYLAAAEPRFDEGLETVCNEAPGRIIVVPYLLFSGLLLNEVTQKVRKKGKEGYSIIHTGQLSRHHVIEDIIIKRALKNE